MTAIGMCLGIRSDIFAKKSLSGNQNFVFDVLLRIGPWHFEFESLWFASDR